MPPKNRRVNSNLLDSIGADLMSADPAEHLSENSLKVEYIPAELIRPDPVQPRRVLPEAIHFEFHAERLTPSQALRELVKSAQIAARQHGRPFGSLADLFAEAEADNDETETAASYTPEEQLLRDLANLAITLRDDGQVNPLTVVDASQGVSRLYRIETGERRYWATWLMRDFFTGYEGDGTIPCIIIPSGKASVFRQARENTARSGLSAIALARQAALLILAVHGVPKPVGAVDNDYYRQALELDLRDKREFTTDILAAMGGVTRSYLSRIKALLALSDEALELADRHHIDEGRLRWVLTLPTQDQVELVRQIIQFDLTRNQVKELCQAPDSPPENDPIEKPSKLAIQFAKILRSNAGLTARDVAKALLSHDQNSDLVRTRIGMTRRLLDEIEQNLE
jgi:hypothetical protein